MRATLSFKLPEEQEEYGDAMLGGHKSYLLNEIDNYCRNLVKHGGCEGWTSEQIYAMLDEIRAMTREGE
jgi:hypothetical protein